MRISVSSNKSHPVDDTPPDLNPSDSSQPVSGPAGSSNATDKEAQDMVVGGIRFSSDLLPSQKRLLPSQRRVGHVEHLAMRSSPDESNDGIFFLGGLDTAGIIRILNVYTYAVPVVHEGIRRIFDTVKESDALCSDFIIAGGQAICCKIALLHQDNGELVADVLNLITVMCKSNISAMVTVSSTVPEVCLLLAKVHAREGNVRAAWVKAMQYLLPKLLPITQPMFQRSLETILLVLKRHADSPGIVLPAALALLECCESSEVPALLCELEGVSILLNCVLGCQHAGSAMVASSRCLEKVTESRLIAVSAERLHIVKHILPILGNNIEKQDGAAALCSLLSNVIVCMDNPLDDHSHSQLMMHGLSVCRKHPWSVNAVYGSLKLLASICIKEQHAKFLIKEDAAILAADSAKAHLGDSAVLAASASLIGKLCEYSCGYEAVQYLGISSLLCRWLSTDQAQQQFVEMVLICLASMTKWQGLQRQLISEGIISVVVQKLATAEYVAEVQQYGLKVIANLCADSYAVSEAAKQGAAHPASIALHAHKTNDKVVTQALNVLARLCDDNDIRAALARESALHSFVQPLQTMGANAAVCHACCRAIASIASERAYAGELIREDGFASLILDRLIFHKSTADTCKEILVVVSLAALQPPLLRSLLRMDVYSKVLSAISSHRTDSKVCAAGLNALWNLSMVPEIVKDHLLAASEDMQNVLGIVADFVSDGDVQTTGFGVLNQLALIAGANLPPEFLKKVHLLCIQSFKQHSEHANVLKTLVSAMATIASLNIASLLSAVQETASLLRTSLLLHAADAELIILMLTAVISLSSSQDSIPLMAASGVFRSVIEVSQKHTGLDSILSASLSIMSINATHPDAAKLLMKEGAGKVACFVSRALVKRPSPVAKALEALFSLGVHQELAISLAHDDAVLAILAAMKTYHDSSEVQLWACKALQAICNHEDSINILKLNDGISAIMKVLSVHSYDPKVMAAVGGIASNLACCDEHITKVFMFDTGALSRLLEISQTHRGVAEVQIAIIGALANTAGWQDMPPRLVHSNAYKTIMTALTTLSSNASLISAVAAFINNMIPLDTYEDLGELPVYHGLNIKQANELLVNYNPETFFNSVGPDIATQREVEYWVKRIMDADIPLPLLKGIALHAEDPLASSSLCQAIAKLMSSIQFRSFLAVSKTDLVPQICRILSLHFLEPAVRLSVQTLVAVSCASSQSLRQEFVQNGIVELVMGCAKLCSNNSNTSSDELDVSSAAIVALAMDSTACEQLTAKQEHLDWLLSICSSGDVNNLASCRILKAIGLISNIRTTRSLIMIDSQRISQACVDVISKSAATDRTCATHCLHAVCSLSTIHSIRHAFCELGILDLIVDILHEWTDEISILKLCFRALDLCMVFRPFEVSLDSFRQSNGQNSHCSIEVVRDGVSLLNGMPSENVCQRWQFRHPQLGLLFPSFCDRSWLKSSSFARNKTVLDAAYTVSLSPNLSGDFKSFQSICKVLEMMMISDKPVLQQVQQRFEIIKNLAEVGNDSTLLIDENCCQNLLSLIRSCMLKIPIFRTMEILVQQGLLSFIYEATTSFPTSDSIQFHSMVIFDILAQSPSLRKKVLDCEAVPSCLSTLENNSGNTAVLCKSISVLSLLLDTETKAVAQDLVELEGAIGLLSSSLMRHLATIEVSMPAISCIDSLTCALNSSVSQSKDPASALLEFHQWMNETFSLDGQDPRQILNSSDASDSTDLPVPSIFQCIKDYSCAINDYPAILHRVFSFAGMLASASPRASYDCLHSGFEYPLLRAIFKHRSHVLLQRTALRSLSTISQKFNDQSSARLLNSSGAIALLSKCAQIHSTDSHIVSSYLGICQILLQYIEGVNQFVVVNGMSALLASLNNHAEEEVHRFGSTVVSRMSKWANEEFKLEILKQGVAQAACTTMNFFPSSFQILSPALFAIRQLVLGVPDSQLIVFQNSDLLNLCTKALNNSSTGAPLCEAICACTESLVRERQCLDYFISKGGVESLLNPVISNMGHEPAVAVWALQILQHCFEEEKARATAVNHGVIQIFGKLFEIHRDRANMISALLQVMARLLVEPRIIQMTKQAGAVVQVLRELPESSALLSNDKPAWKSIIGLLT